MPFYLLQQTLASDVTPSFFSRSLYFLFSSQYAQTYFGLTLFLVLATGLCALLVSIVYLLSLSTAQDVEKRSEYECGFAPFDSATRLPFDVHFYLVGILFLIFDVEIAVLFPWIVSLSIGTWFSFYLMIAFVFILSVGFLYEWKRGALIWPNSQKMLPSAFNKQSSAASLLLLATASTSSFGETLQGLLAQLVQATEFASHLHYDLLPETFLFVVITYLLTVNALELGHGRSKRALALASLKGLRTALLIAGLLYLLQLYSAFGATSILLLDGYLVSGTYTTVMKLVVLLTALFIVYASDRYVRQHTRHLLEYPLMLGLAVLFMLLLVSANHLISAFLALVGFSLNLYVLILFDAPNRVAREAGVKYYYLSTFSGGLILYGFFLLYMLTRTGHFDLIAEYFSTIPLNETATFLPVLGVSLFLTGLLFKLSAFPGHLWAADVYEGAPLPITALFILPVKATVLAFVLRFLTVALEPLSEIWVPVITFAAIGSLLWGCFAALSERNTKRFLAYSSINQIGFLLLGLATASSEANRATLLYLLLYLLMMAGFLMIFLYARRKDGHDLIYLTDFRGLGHRYWFQSAALTLVLFSMAGIPPLAGFAGKYFLLLHAIENGRFLLVIVGLLTSLVSAYYYLRIIKIMWFESKEGMTTVVSVLPVAQRLGLLVVLLLLTLFLLYVAPLTTFLDVTLAGL